MALDKAKLVEIINDHKGIIYKIVNVYAEDPEDRKDLEQEVIIQIWKSLDSYKGDAQISTWIYRVALNVSIAHKRKEKNRKKVNEPLGNLLVEPKVNTSLENEKTQQLYHFINQLDKFNKAIIVLYLDGYSYQEISDIVGITKTNVGVKINRIKALLSKQFENVVK